MKLKKLKYIFLVFCVIVFFIGFLVIVNNSSNDEISLKLNEFDLIFLVKELNC